jgi:hypothetical protein
MDSCGLRERWFLGARVVAPTLFAICAACAAAPIPAPPAPDIARAVAPTTPATTRDLGIPGFFEVGSAVEVPGQPPVDTRGWLDTLLERQRLRGGDAADPEGNVFVYPEPDPGTGALRRYALVLPETQPYSANGHVVAHWTEAPEAFDFGLAGARTFGMVSTSEALGAIVSHPLKARFAYSGTNVQDAELVYDVEGAGLAVLEHKGLVPGLPMSFDRFLVYDRTVPDDREPPAIPAERSPVLLKIGLAAPDRGVWKELEVLEIDGYRVVYLTDAAGGHHFVATPSGAGVTSYLGDLAGDHVIEADGEGREVAARDRNAGALVIPHASAGTILCGVVDDKNAIARDLHDAAAFLDRYDGAMRSLRTGADQRRDFLHFYAHAFLDSHRSRRDPRAMTELPYGDAYYPTNVHHSSANVWFGSDQASVMLGLIAYYRRSGDRSVLDDIGGLADASLEAATPTGSVWMKHFDEMLLTTETDPNTGRRDAFIDNGGVSVNFNHTRMVIRRGYERIAGVTWGAFEPVIGGRALPVDGGDWTFAIDPASIPQSVSTDQDTLSMTRLFARRDGNLRVRESAEVVRGLPAARVTDAVENTGSKPLAVDEVRLTIGDFFHYGDGVNEIAQNRYGFSRVFDGVPLQVGFWMEGLPEPLWGDNAPQGWVDITALYKAHKPRFLAVYGYDKAELYALPREADQVLLYNNAGEGATDVGARGWAGGSKDHYRGWTALQVRYRVGATLAAGDVYKAPPVLTYPLWAPLFSADDDSVPDELQALAPLWTELVDTFKDDVTVAARAAHLRALTDGAKVDRLSRLLYTSIESDYAYAGMQDAWMDAADLFTDLAGSAKGDARRDFTARARSIRAAALRGAEFSLRAMTQLRNRSDLMPAFGIMRYYGFHVAVFDWAYRQTCDPRYRDAMLLLADHIATSEQDGGLQVTDASKPNYGGYVINEFSRASGANNLDDQGIKLWALRIAYERTGDEKYARSAALCIDHWVRVRPADHLFFGISKLFGQYLPTGLDQQRTPYGHYSLLVGLESWMDVNPHARALYEAGLKNATQRHLIHSVGTTGAYYMAFPDEGLVQFGTNAELGGTFLWAMTFDVGHLRGRFGACGRGSAGR